MVSIWLLKYAQIFVLEHYLFLEAHSFPRASLSENCSPLGTDNVRGQMSEHIFPPNGGYCLSQDICCVRTTYIEFNMTIFGQCHNVLNNNTQYLQLD